MYPMAFDPGLKLFQLGLKAREFGRLAVAESCLRRSAALRTKHFGRRHPLVAQSLNFLANVLVQREKNVEAEPLYRESLALRTETLGKEHKDVAASLSNLANLFQDAGR